MFEAAFNEFKNTTSCTMKCSCMISPNTSIDESYILGKKVKPFEDKPDFGFYCLINIEITKENNECIKYQMSVRDKTKEIKVKQPKVFSDMSENECLMFEFKLNNSFYDCDRTYFHFGNDAKTLEGDFMHYKCKMIEAKILHKNE